MCRGLDDKGCLCHCRVSIFGRLWGGDGWLMGPFNHRLWPVGDEDLPPRHPGRLETVDGVARAQASTAEEAVSPLVAVGSSDKPHCPYWSW